MKKIILPFLLSLAIFMAFFSGAWITADISETIFYDGVHTAYALSIIDCHACIKNNAVGGFGGFGFGGAGGNHEGGTGGGGGGGPTSPPPSAPVCTLDLTQNNISWTTTGATNVDITPLTNSPAVPGANTNPGPPSGTSVFSGDFGAFKAQHASIFQTDASANGGAVLGNASFKANKATADRLCSLVFPGSVNSTFHTDTFSSPKNNTIAIWSGSAWSVLPAKGNDPHLRNNFTCVTTGSGGSIYPLSGSKNFIPPLTVGTHTYKLTATGAGGTKICNATVVVPPPPPNAPTCTLTLTEKKIIWNSTNAQSVSITSTTGSQAVGNNLQLNGSKTFTPPLGSGEHFYILSVLGTNGDSVFCGQSVFVAPPPPPPPPGTPSCILTASPSIVDSGDTTTLAWSTLNAVSFSIDHGLGAAPISGGSTTSPAITTATTFTGTVTNANGDVAFCGALVTITSTPPPPPPPPPTGAPSCTLSVSNGNIKRGFKIAIFWTSENVTSGVIDHGIGNADPVASGSKDFIFPKKGTTTYTATFTGPDGDAVCSASVEVGGGGGGGGGGGCVGSCGGSPPPEPKITLASAPTNGQILGASFVSLSQIPYTGFEAGVLLTILFWIAVALWSVGVAYIIIGKESMRFVAERIMSFMRLPIPKYSRTEDVYHDSLDEYASPVFAPSVSQSIASAPYITPPSAVSAPTLASEEHTAPNAPHQSAIDGLPDITDVIESRAHATGVLLSPEAVAIVKALHSERAEALRLFGELLNDAVRTIPREDGWILLSAERVNALIKKTSTPDTPQPARQEVEAHKPSVAPALNDAAVNRFVIMLVSGDRDGAFTFLHTLEHEGASAPRFATGVATTLDALYRSKKNGSVFSDTALKEKAEPLSEANVCRLVEVFAHALDTAYQSQYTGLKIALAQAFDVRAA